MIDLQKGTALSVVMIVLAVIGGIAILGAIAMAVMHSGMMGRMSC